MVTVQLEGFWQWLHYNDNSRQNQMAWVTTWWTLLNKQDRYTLKLLGDYTDHTGMIKQCKYAAFCRVYLLKLQVRKSDHNCLNPKDGSVFCVDSKSESPVHSWHAKVLTSAYIYIYFCHFNLYNTMMSVFWPTLPEPTGDSIIDRDNFLTPRCLAHHQQVVLLWCHFFQGRSVFPWKSRWSVSVFF